MRPPMLIEWSLLAARATWLLGLALLAATWSWQHSGSSAAAWGYRLGGFLVASGMYAGAAPSWIRLAWGLLALAMGVEAIVAWRRSAW